MVTGQPFGLTLTLKPGRASGAIYSKADRTDARTTIRPRVVKADARRRGKLPHVAHYAQKDLSETSDPCAAARVLDQTADGPRKGPGGPSGNQVGEPAHLGPTLPSKEITSAASHGADEGQEPVASVHAKDGTSAEEGYA